MNRILISGAAGFLGSNLAKKLIEDENNIIYAIDNFSSSTISNLYSLLKNERFNFIEGNIKDGFDINVDEFYHLSASGDLSKYYDNKYEYSIETIDIIKSILNYAKQTGTRLIIASSFCDFNNHNNELYEYFNLVNFSTDLVKNYSEKYKINSTIVRLSEGYGKNCANFDNRFIPKCIFSAVKNQDIILDYNESLYFTYSDDIIKAMIKIMDNYIDNNIIDISSDKLYLKSDVANLIIKYLNSSSKVIIKNSEVINPSYIPDLTLLEKLNALCDTPIQKGISETINFIKLMYFDKMF